MCTGEICRRANQDGKVKEHVTITLLSTMPKVPKPSQTIQVPKKQRPV